MSSVGTQKRERNRYSVGKIALHFATITAVLVAMLPISGTPTPVATAQGTCRKIANLDVCGRFLEEWSKGGSEQANLYVNGLPITQRRPEISVADGKTYETQWFERAKYEAHPENRAPYDLLLGLLGTSLAEGRGIVDPYTKKVRNAIDQPFVGLDKPADADGRGKVWFEQTRHTVSGKILEYWNRYGGLKQFGFPLSEPFQEVSEADGKTYTVQYFERNRFELHPEKAAPYDVELGLLGVQQYRLQAVAGDKLPQAPPPGVRSSKDTLVVGTAAEPANLFDFSAQFIGIRDALQMQVVGYDLKGNLRPELAWYVPTIENGGARFVGSGEDRHLQVKYKLRQGMKWSDGKEITSNDIVYAYKSGFDEEFLLGAIGLLLPQESVYNIDNPDKYTAIANFRSYAQARDLYTGDPQRFRNLKPFVDAKTPVILPGYSLATAPVAPEHTLGKVPPKDQAARGYFSDPNLLVTSGAFRLERWDRGQQIVLVPNPHYSLTAPPLLKRIVFRIVTDRARLIAQLRNGDIDVVSPHAIFGAPDEEFRQLEGAGLTLQSVPGNQLELINFNLDRPYFKEKAVRQAIAHAVNRQKIVDTISLGKWPIAHTWLPPGIWSSQQNPGFPSELREKHPLKRYAYNPARANQLLDGAGWMRGADGIRSKGGVRLSFRHETTAVGPEQRFRTTAQTLVEADLKAVGIESKITTVPGREFFGGPGTRGIIFGREFDFAQFSWTFDSVESANDSLYDSPGIPSVENDFGGHNVPGFRNARFDELSTKAKLELERSKLYPLMAEAQAIFSEELPVLPLYFATQNVAHNPKLVNWELTGFLTSPLANAAAIYFR